MGAFFSLGRYFTVNEDNSLIDKIVNNKLEKVQNSSMTSGHVNTADIIPTLWLYLCSFFFPMGQSESRRTEACSSSPAFWLLLKKQSMSEPLCPFWNANPPQPGKEQVNMLSPSSKATTGVCPHSGITIAQAWQGSAGAYYSVSRGNKRKKRPSGGSGMPGEGDFNSSFSDAQLCETFLISQSSPLPSTHEVFSVSFPDLSHFSQSFHLIISILFYMF